MKAIPVTLVAAALLAAASTVSAYTLQKDDGSPCTQDGSNCNVFCDNGDLAGSMNWNGSVWTDGVKWDADRDAEARKICTANGTACT